MNKTTSTLSIRLQLPGEEETDKPMPPDEVIYLWDRIIVAIAIATFSVFAAIAGVWYWLPEPGADASPTITDATQATEDPEAVPPAMSRGHEPQQSAAAIKKNAATTKPIATTIKPDLTPLATESQSTTSRTTAAEPSDIAGQEVRPRAINQQGSAGDPMPEPAADVTAQTTPTNQHNRQTPVPPQTALAKVQILSDHLIRAQLSNNMRHGEPTDHAAAVIPMSEEGLIKVYFFAEFERLKGQTIYYDWFLEDKRMARVRARPQLDTASAHSSKYVDRHMLGQWHVEVRTETGDALGRADFEVR